MSSPRDIARNYVDGEAARALELEIVRHTARCCREIASVEREECAKIIENWNDDTLPPLMAETIRQRPRGSRMSPLAFSVMAIEGAIAAFDALGSKPPADAIVARTVLDHLLQCIEKGSIKISDED